MRISLRRLLGVAMTTAALALVAVAGIGLNPSAAQAASVMGGKITRSEVIARAQFWYNERSSLTYNSSRSSSTFYPDSSGTMYAPDCSGYVSMAWHLNNGSGGLNTRTLPSVATLLTSTPSSSTDLRPGDILDYASEHVILFDKWDTDHVHFWYYSFGSTPISHGYASFSDASLSGWPTSDYAAYRYDNIVDDSSGDWNGDGNVDILARNSSSNIVLYTGDGSSRLTNAGQIGANWGGLTNLSRIDNFAGDGNADVIGIDASGNLMMYEANGTGGFQSGSTQIGHGWTGMTIMATGDYNNDGNPDVLAVSGGNLVLYPGTGNGTFGAHSTIGDGWSTMTPVGGGDFNNDGNQDLVAEDSSGVLWLYPGTGSGGFGTRTQMGTGWGSYTAVSVGDFNNDGNADIIARDSSGALWLYPGSGNGKLSSSTRVQIGSGWGSITAIF